MDDLVAWLRACLDAEARGASDVHDYACDAFEVNSGDFGSVIAIDTKLCDCGRPRGVLARVEAERAILRLHEPMAPNLTNDNRYCAVCDVAWYDRGSSSDPSSWPCQTLRLLAYGHRYDAPGFRPEWAPEGVEVTT